MSESRLDTTPYWRESSEPPALPPLARDLRCDVVVVGGGVTGITTAYLLERAGLEVVLLERHRFAAADSGHTTAHLTFVTDKRLSALVTDLGEEHARAYWDAGRAAMLAIADIVGREDIDCDLSWVEGCLHQPALAAPDGVGVDLREEAELARRLGFAARFDERVPFVDRPGVVFEDQIRIHPLKYLHGLLGCLERTLMFEDTDVTAVSVDPLQVVANGHTVTCRDVVIATHTPIVGATGLLAASFTQTKLALYTSYAIAARIAKGSVPDRLFWDTADPYHYLRIQPETTSDVVIFGGHDHKTGQEDDPRACFDRLDDELRRLVPGATVSHRWSGQVIAPADGLPLIGFSAPHQFAATGFNGNGMTLATVAAAMACDALTGRRNPWRDLFDINRTGLRGGAWNYLKENADYPYYLIRDRLRGTTHSSLAAVARGGGMVVDLGHTKVAAHRDDQGKLTLLSAVCTHLGCLVRWNAAERTWDCPCHGSRFTPSGTVIAGPAETPLADVTTTVEQASAVERT